MTFEVISKSPSHKFVRFFLSSKTVQSQPFHGKGFYAKVKSKGDSDETIQTKNSKLV